eukprot:g36169.t1
MDYASAKCDAGKSSALGVGNETGVALPWKCTVRLPNAEAIFEPHVVSDCAYRCQRCDKTERKRAIATMNVLYGWPAILRLNFTRRITGKVNYNQTWEVDAPSELICPKPDRTWQREAWDRSTSSRTSDTSACVRYKLFAVAVHNKEREDGGHNWSFVLNHKTGEWFRADDNKVDRMEDGLPARQGWKSAGGTKGMVVGLFYAKESGSHTGPGAKDVQECQLEKDTFITQADTLG